MQETKNEVIQAIKVGARDPQAHMAKVEKKFTGLITRKTEQDLDAFLEQERTFKEYQRQIKTNRGVLNLLQYEEPRVIKFGMFELHCDELVRALIKRVESMISKLIEKMKTEHLGRFSKFLTSLCMT